MNNHDNNGYLQPRPQQPQIHHREMEAASAKSECGGQASQYSEDFDVPQSGNVYTSLRARKMALRRKRSLSVADLPVRGQKQPPISFKAEESGYDSDVTRKSSPRGSLKNCENNYDETTETGSSTKDTDSMSSGSEDSGAQVKNKAENPVQPPQAKKDQPAVMIKKPPRKSKLPEPVMKSRQTGGENAEKTITPQNGRRFKKNGEDSSSGPDSMNSEASSNNLPSLTSKRFKMLRLKKDVSGELGIIISKKRHPQKGTTGYIIAHVEPGGLVER